MKSIKRVLYFCLDWYLTKFHETRKDMFDSDSFIRGIFGWHLLFFLCTHLTISLPLAMVVAPMLSGFLLIGMIGFSIGLVIMLLFAVLDHIQLKHVLTEVRAGRDPSNWWAKFNPDA